jgi:hypothetical protein
MFMVPSMIHFLAPLEIREESDLLPSNNESAPSKIDLPDPVSPVMAVSPGPNSRSR